MRAVVAKPKWKAENIMGISIRIEFSGRTFSFIDKRQVRIKKCVPFYFSMDVVRRLEDQYDAECRNTISKII
jgi:hypothetical protein